MAVWADGKLVKVNNHINTRHQLNTAKLDGGWPSEVNSFHQWGLDSCPLHFKVKARTDDGVIEAIKHNKLPWEGWMWHPERDSPFGELEMKRVKELFNGKD